MATPIGHALAGGLAYAIAAPRAVDRSRALALGSLCVLFALLPDFDFLPGLLVGEPARYHQGISHSLIVGALVALAGAAVAPARAAGFARIWALLWLAYASHLLVDWLGPDARAPFGIPLLWPLDDGDFLAPTPVFLGVSHAHSSATPTGEWIGNIFQARNLRAIGVEVAVVLPVLAAAQLARRYGSKWRASR